MLELQRLRPDHETAVLEFEQANRAYFAQSISDRGDDFFADFAALYRALLDEQETGVGLYHVLVDEDATVVGRFNLYRVADGTAEVGFRVAQQVAGRGVATAGLMDLCRIAGAEYELRTLRAAVSHENIASQRVVAKAGFVAIGPAEFHGRHGLWYELTLASHVD